MPFTYVKTGGVWKTVQRIYVKDAGSWKDLRVGLVTQSGVGKQFYPDSIGPTTFASPGTYTYTVPVTVTSLSITTIGGSGGGGGGGNSSAGLVGGTSYKDIRTISVTAGQVLTIVVGAGGQGGRSAISNCGSNAATWIAIDNDPAQRRGFGGAGYANGGAGSGYGCPNSFNATGGWSGGGGGSSAFTYSGGTVTAGGGAGGNGGKTYDGGNGTGGTAGNATTGNQGATGVAGGAGQTSQFSGYGGDGSSGSVVITPVNANVTTFSSNNTWTAPIGVTSITLTVAGGGGGQGGNFLNTSRTTYNGAAGTGGQVVTGTVAVTPGQTYTVTVGSGGGFGANNFYTAAGGSSGAGYASGSAGTASGNGSGGGGGGSTAFLSGATVLASAAGGTGGAGSVGGSGGAGGAGGGSNVIPAGGSSSTGSNGGAASNITASYSGSFSNGSGTGQLETIRTTLISTYPFLYNTIGGSVFYDGSQFTFQFTLAAGTGLVGSGAQQGARVYSAYSTPYSVLNAGGFYVGNTVSGINFTTTNTQGNGGQQFWFFTGFTYNNGGSGYVTISY